MLTSSTNRGDEYAQLTIEKAGKPAPNPMEQREIDRLEAPAENQGRLVDPDQASGGEARPGFGHVQSGHRQQATRLRHGQPEREKWLIWWEIMMSTQTRRSRRCRRLILTKQSRNFYTGRVVRRCLKSPCRRAGLSWLCPRSISRPILLPASFLAIQRVRRRSSAA